MSPNLRIFLNVIATYGRSLYAVVCGLFTSRWVLMALGTVDYGLYGVVGGLTAFITFFNSLLASAISRFYAVSVGQAQAADNSEVGVAECRKWFSVALCIHVVVPVLLILIGYPIGCWAVRNFLTIPPDRMTSCIWVFRFVCLSCFVAMLNVPYQAMYVAKQMIAELTIYSVAQTTLNVCFLYFMVTHPGDWLSRYALWTCLVAVVPQGVICLRARLIFPECRFDLASIGDWRLFRQVVTYAGWQGFCSFGGLLRSQGIAILVNRSFGPGVNASLAVAHATNGQTSVLSGAILSAFSPAISNAYGAGKYDLVRHYVMKASKFAVLMTLLVMVPLAMEIDQVLVLWLKTPPEFVSIFCLCLMIGSICEFATNPHVCAVNATGEVAQSKFVYGVLLIMTLPCCYLQVKLGLGFYSIGVAYSFFMFGSAVSSVYFAQRQNGIPIIPWVRQIVFPSLFVAVGAVLLAVPVRLLLPVSFIRLALVTLIAEIAMGVGGWFFVLDASERKTLLARVFKNRRNE